MTKMMVKVKKDLMAEKTGLPSMVGEMVEVVRLLPAHSRLRILADYSPLQTVATHYEVYLVVARESRWMKGPARADGVVLEYQSYYGNDVYSAEELGISK